MKLLALIRLPRTTEKKKCRRKSRILQKPVLHTWEMVKVEH